MPVTRQSTFTAGATLQAAQLSDEFDHLVGALDGTGVVDVSMAYNGVDVPVLTMNASANGEPWEAQINGTAVARITTVGQIQSTLATGTAPLLVASTTLNANFNADFLDGYEASGLIRGDQASQVISAASSIVALEIEATGQGADAGEAYVYFDTRDTTANVDAWFRVGGVGTDIFLIQAYDDGVGWKSILEADRNGGSPYVKVYDPTTAALQEVATTKATTTISVGAFFEGVASTGAKQIRWIAPANAETIVFDKMQAVYGGGTATGTTHIQVEWFNSAGTSQGTRGMDILLTSTDAADVVKVHDMTDITGVSVGDYFEIKITAADLHEDI
jgi:hypothetical protein